MRSIIEAQWNRIDEATEQTPSWGGTESGVADLAVIAGSDAVHRVARRARQASQTPGWNIDLNAHASVWGWAVPAILATEALLLSLLLFINQTGALVDGGTRLGGLRLFMACVFVLLVLVAAIVAMKLFADREKSTRFRSLRFRASESSSATTPVAAATQAAAAATQAAVAAQSPSATEGSTDGMATAASQAAAVAAAQAVAAANQSATQTDTSTATSAAKEQEDPKVDWAPIGKVVAAFVAAGITWLALNAGIGDLKADGADAAATAIAAVLGAYIWPDARVKGSSGEKIAA